MKSFKKMLTVLHLVIERSRNFKNTHARYIRNISDFVSVLKETYPAKSIFLEGSSFGGFFVSSYGLLQSIGLNTPVFNRIYVCFVQHAFNEQFEGSTITPVNGIISNCGGIHSLRKMINAGHHSQLDWSQYLAIPAFYHWNFDDDRINFREELKDILFSFLSSANAEYYREKPTYNKHITLSVRRDSVIPVLNTSSINIEDIHNIKSIITTGRDIHGLSTCQMTSRRGHTSDCYPNGYEQITHFIHHAYETINSPLHQARQKRLFNMYWRIMDPYYQHGHDDTFGVDVQQFLSNLRTTQAYLEQINKENLLSRSSLCRLRKEEIIERHMYRINSEDLEKYHDELMSFSSTRTLWRRAIQSVLQQARTQKENLG